MLHELLLCVAVCGVAADGNEPDVAAEAPVVKTFKIAPLPNDGHPSLYTCGSFLAAISSETHLIDRQAEGCAHGELWCLNWSRLEVPPVVTPLLRPYEAAMLGDGTIAETVRLGLPRKTLLEAARAEKNRKASESISPEDIQTDAQERRERENRYRKSADEEDRFVARMKYLQEIRRTGGGGLVIRNLAGTQFTTIACDDTQWHIAGISSSKNGKRLAVWQFRIAQKAERKATSGFIRAGVVDQDAHSIRATVTGKDGFPIEMVVSDDGRRLVLFGAVIGKAGWICMIDLQKQAVLWERDDIAETACFSSGDISANGERVYAADELGGVFRLDGDTGKQLAKWDLAGGIILSPDGRFLAVMSGDPIHRVAVHEAESGKLVQYVTPRGPHFDAAFSPNSRFLAIGTNNAVCIYDLTAALKDKRGQHPAEKVSRVPHAEPKQPTISGTTPPQ